MLYIPFYFFPTFFLLFFLEKEKKFRNNSNYIFLHIFVAFLTPIPQFVRLRVVWEMDYIKERRLLDVLSLAL